MSHVVHGLIHVRVSTCQRLCYHVELHLSSSPLRYRVFPSVFKLRAAPRRMPARPRTLHAPSKHIVSHLPSLIAQHPVQTLHEALKNISTDHMCNSSAVEREYHGTCGPRTHKTYITQRARFARLICQYL